MTLNVLENVARKIHEVGEPNTQWLALFIPVHRVATVSHSHKQIIKNVNITHMKTSYYMRQTAECNVKNRLFHQRISSLDDVTWHSMLHNTVQLIDNEIGNYF